MSTHPKIKLPAEIITNKGVRWLNGWLVQFAVSSNQQFYDEKNDTIWGGFEVPPPIVPEGYKLVSIGISQTNTRPPFATQFLKKI